MSNLLLNPGFETWSGGTSFSLGPGQQFTTTANNWQSGCGVSALDANMTLQVSKDIVVFDSGLASIKNQIATTTNPPLGDFCQVRQIQFPIIVVTGNVITFTVRVKIDATNCGVTVTPLVFNGNVDSNGTSGGIFVQKGSQSNWTTLSTVVGYTGTTPNLLRASVVMNPQDANGTAVVWLDTFDFEVTVAQPISSTLNDSILSQDWVSANKLNEVTFGD
jgi:hypothetical protein